MSVKLYELTEQFQMLQDMDLEGQDDIEVFDGLLNELEGEFRDKVVNVGLVMQEAKAEENAIAEEIKRLQAKKAAAANKYERLRGYLHMNLVTSGIKKVSDYRLTVAIQKNPPSVRVEDETLIPTEYFVPQDPKLDKKSIAADLKAGKAVPGAELSYTESVRVR